MRRSKALQTRIFTWMISFLVIVSMGLGMIQMFVEPPRVTPTPTSVITPTPFPTRTPTPTS